METIVISLGGSVLAPADIDIEFLKGFRALILKFVKKGRRFCIICGGGRTARNYMNAAAEIVKMPSEDLDWLGIHATRLNAQLLRNILRDIAHRRVIRDPTEKIHLTHPVIIGAGWKPGRSTDYQAVRLAKNVGAKTVVNITNTKYVYDKDPSKHDGAKPLNAVSWKDFRKILGTAKWSPGLNAPFDPVAARLAQSSAMTVAIMGKDLKNLEGFLNSGSFDGTLIT